MEFITCWFSLDDVEKNSLQLTFMTEDIFHLGVKALIQNQENQLLVLHKKFKNPSQEGRISWDLPGGRIQRNESMEKALEREVFEETGLENLPSKKFLTMVLSESRIFLPTHDVGLIFAVYLCLLEGHVNIQLSDEHFDYQWVSPQEAAEMLKSDFPAGLIHQISALDTLQRR